MVYILKSADDVKLIWRVGSEQDAARLRINLASLGNWAEKWQIIFSVEKCKVMNIGFKNRKKDFTLNGVPLIKIKEEKDLGVIVCHI